MLYKASLSTIFIATLVLSLGVTVDPANPISVGKDIEEYDPQTLVVASYIAPPAIGRDSYHATSKAELDAIQAEKDRVAAEAAAAEAAKNRAIAAPQGTPDPGSAKAYAQGAVANRGWGTGEYDCLVALWNKESGWNAFAMNQSSGAYGIPQALPGNKMASAGADWQTNANTQIEWGLGYIAGRYGTPCGAYASSQAKGWY